jgi:hypothetical protein
MFEEMARRVEEQSRILQRRLEEQPMEVAS